MKEVFIIYITDNYHSYRSRDVIGIATDFETAIILSEIYAINDGNILNKDQIINLNRLKQTQGYEGEGEFVIENVKVDELL